MGSLPEIRELFVIVVPDMQTPVTMSAFMGIPLNPLAVVNIVVSITSGSP